MALSRGGSLWSYRNATPVSVTTTPVKYTLWQRESNVGADTSSGDDFNIEVPGYYMAVINLSFMGTTGVTYFAQLYKNSSAQSFRGCATATTNSAFNISFSGVLDLDEGDVVSVYVFSNSGVASNFILVDGQFSLMSV